MRIMDFEVININHINYTIKSILNKKKNEICKTKNIKFPYY